jgi:hypothetical protein
MQRLIKNHRQSGSIAIVDLRGSIVLGEASLALRQSIRDQNHPKFVRSEFHGQCRSWGTGWRLHSGEVQGRRAEVLESDEKGV